MRIILLILCIATYTANAQNVGVGTNSPTGRLQINHNSSTTNGLLIVDSSASRTGLIAFKNANQNQTMMLHGYNGGNSFQQQYIDIRNDSTFIATFQGNGRLGIKNTSPTEALDVTGNINVTGTIKANGITGESGQVLTSNGSGGMLWSNLSEFPNFVSFRTTGASTWAIPAGVNKILVELWGAGGGGNGSTSGGAGCYIQAIINVTAGNTWNYSVGAGGASGTTGGSTTFSRASSSISLSAGGGYSVLNSPCVITVSGLTSYIGLEGETRKTPAYDYQILNGNYYIFRKEARGGNAPLTNNTGGPSGFSRNNGDLSGLVEFTGSNGSSPGGGGGFPSGPGGNGMIIVRY